MPTRSLSPYFISLLLHGSVVALILFLAYLAHESLPESPKVFELVAGAGDNYGATEAPALGSPGGLKIELPPEPQTAPLSPPLPIPDVTPTPAVPQPAAQEEAPPVKLAPAPAQAPSKAKPSKDAVPNFAKTVKRIENKRAARLMAKYKKQLEAEQRQEQMSYDEYMKHHGRGQATEGIAQGVTGGSRSNKTGGAGGKALTREQGELLDAYFALLKARITENLVPPSDVSDKLQAVVEFYIAADGSLSRPHVVQSSGSPEFDRAALEAFAHTHSIGPRPDGRGEMVTLHVGLRDEEE